MLHYLRRLLESMDYYDAGCEYDLFIADNVSEDGTVQFLEQEFRKRENLRRLHLSKDNLWDHNIYNLWIPTIESPHILFLNADVRVLADGWCSSMIEEAGAHPEAGLVGDYAVRCECILPDMAPKEIEWIRLLYTKRAGTNFDHLGHIHNSIFLAPTDLFKRIGLFWLPRIMTDRHDNIASEIEFSIRLRQKGYKLRQSEAIKKCFKHFGQRFPMKTYEEILAREKELKLPEMG